jgi:hypothetical protein
MLNAGQTAHYIFQLAQAAQGLCNSVPPLPAQGDKVCIKHAIHLLRALSMIGLVCSSGWIKFGYSA